MLKRIAILSLSAVLATSVFAHHHHGQRGGMSAIMHQLDLSMEQRQDIRQIMQQGRQDHMLFKADFRDIGQQMRQHIQTDTFNADAVKALLTERSSLGAELALDKATRRHQVWNLLNEEQQTEFEQLTMAREHRNNQEHALKRLEKLNLSDEQSAQIAQIRNEHAQYKEQAHTQINAFKAAQAELVKAREFDQNAWKSLFDSQVDKRIEFGVTRAKVRHQVWNILTEEQQQQAQSMMRKEWKKHHRNQLRGSI